MNLVPTKIILISVVASFMHNCKGEIDLTGIKQDLDTLRQEMDEMKNLILETGHPQKYLSTKSDGNDELDQNRIIGSYAVRSRKRTAEVSITKEQCWDSNGNKTNQYDDGCDFYVDELTCEMGEFYDDKDFKSDKMCCTCGGGRIGTCINTHGSKRDQEGYGCNEYKTSTSCGKNDHEEFNSYKMCCSCGGGRFEFTWRTNATCLGEVLEGFSSLSSAKDGCKDDKNCIGIFDVGCDNKLFWTCQGKIEPGKTEITEKSCAWDKFAIESDEDEQTNSQKNNSSNQLSKDIKPKSKSPPHKIPAENKILTLLVTLVFVMSLVSFIWRLKRKNTRTELKLTKHLESTFVIICIILASFMTIKETLRYLKNEDISTITYKNFATSSQDTYPTFSLCFMDDNDEGIIYEHFKDDITATLPMAYDKIDPATTFSRILKGEKISIGLTQEEALSIYNISEAYANMFSIKFEELYDYIEFTTEHSNDTLTLYSNINTNESLPVYLSYQDPSTICFTRKDDKNLNIIRMEDSLNLFREELEKFQVRLKFKIFIHHPGQLLRGFDAPVFESEMRHIDWDKPMLTFKIMQQSIWRKRPDAIIPCNSYLYDDDLKIRMKISEVVGCIPVYWKNIMPILASYEICHTPEEMEKSWQILQNLTSIFSSYDPPCNEMKLAVTYDKQPIFFHENQFLFTIFKYTDRNYQEIVNVREFGLESLWSSVGGFVGIFVGTSLSHLPSLIATNWTWFQNKIKSNTIIKKSDK